MLSYLIIPYGYPYVSIYIQTLYPVILSYHVHLNLQTHNLRISMNILILSFNILIFYPFEYPPTPPMSGGVGGVGGNDTDGPGAGAPPPPTPPVVRNRLCWPGDRRWNKNQLLTPLMRRFDVLTFCWSPGPGDAGPGKFGACASEPFHLRCQLRCRRLACERHITHCYYTMPFIHPAVGNPAV